MVHEVTMHTIVRIMQIALHDVKGSHPQPKPAIWRPMIIACAGLNIFPFHAKGQYPGTSPGSPRRERQDRAMWVVAVGVSLCCTVLKSLTVPHLSGIISASRASKYKGGAERL